MRSNNMSRDARHPPMHIVAVGGLVTNATGQVLIIRTPRRDWEFPGGQVEQGETLPGALEREILEETGIVVSVKSLAGLYSNLHEPTILMADFICAYVSGDPRVSDESLEVRWVHRMDVLPLIKRPAIRARMKDMLEFSGAIVYRAYAVDAFDNDASYGVRDERLI